MEYVFGYKDLSTLRKWHFQKGRRRLLDQKVWAWSFSMLGLVLLLILITSPSAKIRFDQSASLRSSLDPTDLPTLDLLGVLNSPNTKFDLGSGHVKQVLPDNTCIMTDQYGNEIRVPYTQVQSFVAQTQTPQSSDQAAQPSNASVGSVTPTPPSSANNNVIIITPTPNPPSRPTPIPTNPTPVPVPIPTPIYVPPAPYIPVPNVPIPTPISTNPAPPPPPPPPNPTPPPIPIVPVQIPVPLPVPVPQPPAVNIPHIGL